MCRNSIHTKKDSNYKKSYTINLSNEKREVEMKNTKNIGTVHTHTHRLNKKTNRYKSILVAIFVTMCY